MEKHAICTTQSFPWKILNMIIVEYIDFMYLTEQIFLYKYHSSYRSTMVFVISQFLI